MKLERLKENKKAIIILILLLITVSVGISYAYWKITLSQSNQNAIASSCFKITFKEETNGIQLDNAYPITDEEGKNITPYTFTITNECDEFASYQINLEILEDTTLNSQYIKVLLNEEVPEILTEKEVVEKTLKEATTSYKLKVGYLNSKESLTYDLRLWMDEDTQALEETMNKVFASKVTITASYLDHLPTDYEKCVANYGEENPQCQILAHLDTTGKCAEIESNGTVNLNRNYENEEINEGNMQTITNELIETEEGYVCSAPDDYGTSYYFRGNVENNWVKFADSYWRIIRVNGDGSIRLLYNGEASVIDALDPEVKTQVLSNGYNDSSTKYTIIGESAYNESYDDNTYVGYMYGNAGSSSYEETHQNIHDSTIKQYIDTWYEEKIRNTEYENFINDTLFCNDRNLISEEPFTLNDVNYTQLGYGTEITEYRGDGDPGFFLMAAMKPSYADVVNIVTKNPTLKCARQDDRFTVKDTNLGNGDLTYPVALLTIDEIYLAGGSSISPNENYYLYNGDQYWSLSPFDFYSVSADVRYVYDDGSAVNDAVDGSRGVRPVLNLKSGSLKKGSGTANDPYMV